MINGQTLGAVRRTIWRLLFRAGVTGDAPTDAQIEAMARLQRAMVVDSPGLRSLHGCLSASPRGMLIRVNPSLTWPDRRYTIAHEIGHTIIDRDVPTLRSRLTVRIDPPLDLDDHDREWLCDWIAAEILLPKPVFLASVQTEGRPTDFAVASDIPTEAVFIHLRSNQMQQLPLMSATATGCGKIIPE